jgi:phosphohistidine swiveling domain-containing protein
MASFVEFTGVKCRNIERASLFERGYAYANERYFRFANASLTLKACLVLVGRTLGTLLLIGLPFRKRALWLSRFAHKVFLKSASKRVLHKWHSELDFHVSAIRRFDPSVSDLKLAAAKIHELRALSFGFFKTDLAIHCLKEANVHLLIRVLGMRPDRITRFGQNETLMMHLSLQTLCDALKGDPGSAAFIEALKRDDSEAHRHLTKTSRALFSAFLEHCGHMSEGWDVTSRALRENSAAIARLIEMAMRQERKALEKRQELPTDLPIDLEHMFAQAQALCAADEQQHFYAGLYLEKSRKVLDSIAKLMIEKNLIENSDDLHYLTAIELEKFLENPDFTLSHFVRRKRKIWSRYKNVAQPLDTVAAQQLNGIAVSHGVAQGKCYFADSFGDLEQMPENAVLCLKTPNPSFVPWFNHCSAIVTENGGALSHGFIAARELQIPAVCGIRLDDLKLLDHVIVDGSKGHVSSSRVELTLH